MHSRSTSPRQWTAVIAIVAASTMLAACQRAENARTDTTAAGEVVRHDSTVDTTVGRPAVGPDTTATRVANNDGWSDAQMLAFAAAADNSEIAQGRLAERKAMNPSVKAFAREMVTAHQAMLREGKSFASGNNITPDTTKSDVTGLMKDSHDVVADLTNKAAGNDWDGAYIDKQIDAHKAVLDKFQDFEKSTTNTQLKDMLNKAVGKVQSHLTKAQDIKANKIKA